MTKEPSPDQGSGAPRAFRKALLADLQALEEILSRGMIESGVRRFGAEQEAFLVNEAFLPSLSSPEVLERLGGDPFTTELARFNLEMNLQPVPLKGPSFRTIHEAIDFLLAQAREAAAQEGADVLLAGILPTITKADLTLDNITPVPRYRALNDALNRLRGGTPYNLKVVGWDDLPRGDSPN